jgi:anaerobic glycerol-3-phosphate dehydrogenase
VGNKEFTKELTEDGDDRLRVKINAEKGRVNDIVIQYESKIKDKWHAIVRYDCSHGFFHRDILNPKGEKVKQPISISNLMDALTYAEQDIKDRWEWYKEKFKKGLKS